MNEYAYYLGVFKRIWDIISFPLCLFILVIYIFTHNSQKIVYTISPVVAVSPDGSSILLLSDNTSAAFRTVAINVANRVAKIVYGYSNDGQYAASAANVSKLFEENSSGARTFREMIQKNLSEAKLGNSVFTLDPKNTIAALDPKDSSIMVVIANGFQTISNSAGTTTKNVKINLTMYFSETRGKDGDIFKIYQISFN